MTGHSRVTSTTRVALQTLAALLTLSLIGCDSTDAQAPDGDDEVTGADAGSEQQESPSEVDTQNSVDEATLVEVELTPSECVIGDWVADNEFFLTSIREFGDEFQSVTGAVHVTFGADGTLTTDYRDWLLSASAEGHAVTILRAGIDTGTFTATDDTINIADTAMGSTLTVSGTGLNMVVDPDPAQYTEAPYTCDPAAMVITTSDGMLRMSRHE